MSVFYLSLFNRTVGVHCEDDGLRRLLLGVYGALQQDPAGSGLDLEYRVSVVPDSESPLCLQRIGHGSECSQDDGMFLYLFEKDMTIELERIRKDLYFLHAASLEYRGCAHLLVAESGGGKSTTSWALLHHGFNYASDELAPVDLASMQVLPYPHALCLKREPPAPYPLPREALTTSRTIHVPVDAMPAKQVDKALPLRSIFFVRYNPQANSPSVQAVSAAQAGARVYANGLNQLAHPGDGLDAALAIAQHCNCYELETAELKASCERVIGTLDKDVR